MPQAGTSGFFILQISAARWRMNAYVSILFFVPEQRKEGRTKKHTRIIIQIFKNRRENFNELSGVSGSFTKRTGVQA